MSRHLSSGVEARLVQWEVDWLVQSHLVLEQQTLLLIGTLPVFLAMSSYSTIPKAFPLPCSQQVALVALAQSCGQDLPSPCLLPTVTV